MDAALEAQVYESGTISDKKKSRCKTQWIHHWRIYFLRIGDKQYNASVWQTDLKLREESLVIKLPLRYIKMAEIRTAEISAMKKL
jgi:hypothetical protein